MQAHVTQSDVVIVGGGLAGLSAAVYLARGGVSVTLYEKAANLGGRASTQIHDGYYFNRGVHALYCGGATEAVLKELAIPYSAHAPNRGVFALKSGKLHLTPFSPMTLLRTSLFGLADKLDLLRIFATLPKLDAHAFRQMSIGDWLEKLTNRPNVHQFLAANARTFVYSTALDVVSAELLIWKLQTAFKHPVVYIDGGWQTLVDGLRHAAERAGAKIISGAPIESVEYDDGRVSGVRLRDGSVHHASAVIIATRPQDAVKVVGEYAPLREIVSRLIPAQVAGMDVALRRLPNPRYPIVQDMENPLFMSTQSEFSRIAPEGGALIYAFKQLDPRESSDPREDERDLENFLDTTQAGWRKLVVKRQFLPRIDALGTLPTAKDGGFEGRPKPAVTGIDGLYLAGDWIGAEGFLADPSLASARDIAYTLINGKLASLRSNTNQAMVRV